MIPSLLSARTARTAGVAVLVAAAAALHAAPAAADTDTVPPSAPILFSQNPDAPDLSDVWTIRPDTGEATQLWADTGASYYRVHYSPDGELVMGTNAWGPPTVSLRDMEGNLIDRVSSPGAASSVGWSPDGTRVAYWWSCVGNCFPEVDDGYRVYDVDELRPGVRLTGGMDWQGSHPDLQDWHPEGEHITYPDGTQIRNFAADGSWDNELMLDHGDPVDQLRWNRAGDRLAFTADSGAQWDLLLTDPDGSETTALASFDEPVHSLAWSPEGDWLALSGNLGSGHGIYLLPLDSPGTLTHIHTFDPDDRSKQLDWHPVA